MDKKTISTMKKMFDDIMHTTEDGTVEFWYARELMGCLGYTTWRRFKDAINRAMESCKSAEIEVSDHFADAVKMVEIGSNAVRDVDDIMLTRYACYLIAQNGDPRKEENYENLKKGYRKIFMSVAWMMLDLGEFVQKVIRHYLVEEVRRK